MAAPAVGSSGFDEEDPLAFYLHGGADMAVTADATLVVEGRRLRVHSQVLSLQSVVLRGLFADLHSSSQEGAGPSKRKRKAGNDDEEPVIEAPFQDCSLDQACVFLHYCYCAGNLTEAVSLGPESRLAGLLRLAHKLDAPQIQQAVCERIADKARSAMPTQLLEWASAADHCQLPTLHLQCLSEVASRLVGGHGSISLASAFADAAMVAERCDKSMLAQLLGLVVAGTTPGCVPTPEDAAAALQEAANARSFEWEMACDLDAPPSYGLAVCSPWFASGGRQWGFEVMVNDGDDDYELVAGKLTVTLACKQAGTWAKWSIAIVDQAAEDPEDITWSSEEPELFGETHAILWQGFSTSHARLRSRPGYLAGGRLVLRARVEVVL